MQKTITKVLILVAVLTVALGVNYIFAAWTGPTQNPTDGNTSTPIHVGSTNQVKTGGLSLNALSVFGSGYFQGKVGVGVVTPSQDLEVAGQIKIGKDDSVSPTEGTIRWTGTDFEGHNGSDWVSLVSGETVVTVDPNYTDCVNAGGSWIDAISTCYFPGTSCPSGWSKNASYGSTRSNSCSGGGGGCAYNAVGCTGCAASSCTTSSHIRQNTGTETCSYTSGGTIVSLYRGGGGPYKCSTSSRSSHTCTATQFEVGCTKN